jgi:FecR protein
MQNFNTTFKMSLLAAALFSAQGAYAASVGTVTFTTDGATITHADKTVTPAKKSAELMAGDVIDTNAGRLQLSLIDGGKVSLQPNTTYKIERYEFASGKEDGSEYAITELVKGGMRTVSGLIGHKNRDRYQLKTAVATIGIRGTEFTVNFNDNNLLMTTNHGSVDVCNVGGCLNAVSGQTIAVAGLGASPKPSKTAAKAAAAAPAAGKAVFAAAETTDVKKLAAEQIPVVVAPTTYRGVSYFANNTALSGYYDADLSGAGVGDNITKIKNLYTGVTYENQATDGVIFPIANVLTMGVIRNASNANSEGSSGDLHYIVGVAPDVNKLSNLKGTYTVAAASPVMFDVGDGSASQNISAVGTAATDKVNGQFNFDFTKHNYDYSLNIPTTDGNYNVASNGSLALNANGTFGSDSVITFKSVYTGQPVLLGTTTGQTNGALQGGNTVLGSFFGAKGQAVGLVYGFSGTHNFIINAAATGSDYGIVHGSVVLK